MPPRKYSSRPWTPPAGHQPIPNGPAWGALGVLMAAARAAEGDRATADGTRFRGSMALDCERKIAMQALGISPTIDLETGQLVTFDVGQSYHDRIQQALADTFGAQCEVKVSYKPEHDISGHADAVYEHAGQKVVVEIKSMKAYAFELSLDGNRWDNYGPGPKREHIVQAAIYGLAPQIEATALHMIYICKDDGRMAEWILPMHQAVVHFGEPVTPAQLARDELERLSYIGSLLDKGQMPPRRLPGHGIVLGIPPRPNTSERPWNCRYCGWRDLCEAQPAEAFPIAELNVEPW